MSTDQYVFGDAQQSRELERLQAIEQVFDPASRSRIQSTGITEQWRCLEVGAGAGSISRWLATVVGEQGQVVAVDLTTQFLAHLNQPNVEVFKVDIRQFPLEQGLFDLVHARYVLIHLPDFQAALSKMIALLKPGGWLVLEEPDFSVARAISGATRDSVNRVNQAILQMYENRGVDAALGVKLPAILQELGLEPLTVENDVPLANGGSGIASVMKMSALQLAEKYIATGKATQIDIENYCQFAENRNTWAIYYATVGVMAQKAIVQPTL